MYVSVCVCVCVCVCVWYMYIYIYIYINDIYLSIYKQDLALKNPQGLICHKHRPTNQPTLTAISKNLLSTHKLT